MKKRISILTCICILISCLGMTQINASAKSKKVTVPKPIINSINQIDTTTLKIKWSKVNNVSGYQIYYKVSGSSYKRIKTVGKNVRSYTHKNLKTNKKYFYKVRAYKVVKGKKYYSKWSNQLGKKTTNYLMELVKPYSTAWQGYSEYISPNSVQMGGKSYSYGFGLCSGGYAYFNLGGKYKKISFIAGLRDGCRDDYSISIVSDDYIVKKKI